MRKGLFTGAAPFTQLILAAFAMLACGLLLTFVGLLLAPLFLDISLFDIMSATQAGGLTENLALMRYLQVVQGIALFIVPALFLGWLFSGNAVGYFGFRRTTSARNFGIVTLTMLAAIPVINLLAMLNEMISLPEKFAWLEEKLRASENARAEITELFLSADTLGGMLFNLFMIAILAAVGEELIFRGVVQKILVRMTGNIHAGIILAGFLFSMMHLQFYGFFPRWLLGVMFGYMLVWTGTVWVPVFAHFVNNAAAVVVTFFVHKGALPESTPDFGISPAALPFTALAAAICAMLLWRLSRTSKNISPGAEIIDQQ